jgi:hypothetical protein
MDLSKSYDFFRPDSCPEKIHIIGCGAVGSTLAENLVRLGLTNIVLYDFDVVDRHNIANQMFRDTDIGRLKTEALAEQLIMINPEVKEELVLENEGYLGQKLNGYVFLCVDNIDLRREIATSSKTNPYIKAMFDFRIRLTDAQHYAARWDDLDMVENFIGTMDFTHEEAKADTPVSACNLELSVAPTIRSVVACGVANFMNFVKSAVLKKMILVDAFSFLVDAF